MSTYRRRLVVLAALALGANGCASASLGGASADVAGDATGFAAMAASDDVIGFSDGHRHFVLMTSDHDAPPDGDLVLDVPRAGLDESGSVVVHRGDEPLTVDVPAGSLVAVVATSDAERAAVAEHADSAIVSLLVADVTGALGEEPGTRYVATEHGLYPVDGTPSTDSTVAPADARVESGVVASPVDAAVLDAVRELEPTVDASLVSPGLVAVTTDSDGSDLEDVPGVAAVHEDVVMSFFDDTYQPYQWMLDNTGAASQANGVPGVAGADVNAPEVWPISTGAGSVVAVVDTGVQSDHPDLAGRVVQNADEICGNGIDDDRNGYVDDCAGWDFGMSDNDPRPDPSAENNSHGTHVAGIIGAPRNGIGVVGIAPDAQVMNLKVGRPDGSLTLSAVAAGIDYAVANGADVINLSLGTPPGTPRAAVAPLEAAVTRAVTAGVIVVAAAGNNGADISWNTSWPASFSTFLPVITVGASTNSDRRASFSNYGTPISIWAPGEWILSTISGSTYAWMSGTSMATPVVAGAAAVLRSVGVSTPTDVRELMASSAASVTAGPRLDVAAAVAAAVAGSVDVRYRGADTMIADQGGTLSIDVSVDGVADVAGMTVSVATRDGSDVMAVSGLTASVLLPSGTVTQLVTDESGAFPSLPLGLVGSGGASFAATMVLPAGEYAFVTELWSGSGEPVGGVDVAYLGVGAETPDTTVPVTTVPPDGGGGTSPGTTVPVTTVPSTSVPDGGWWQPPVTSVPSTSVPDGGWWQPPVTSAPPDGGWSPVTTAPATTAPPDGGGGGAGPVTTSPLTTAPPDGRSGSPGTTTPVTTPPVTTTPATTVPGDGGLPPAPGTTAPATTAPANPVTPTTAPPPSGSASTTMPTPDQEGAYSIAAVTPGSGRLDGGEPISVTGAFPTWVPVYVWFGSVGAVEAYSNDGTTLRVITPPSVMPMITDVTVKFRTARQYELTLPSAFSFRADSGGSGGGATTTVPPGGSPGTTVPATTVPVTTVPPGGSPGTTAPATTVPPGGSPGTTAPATTVPPGGGGSPGTTAPATTVPPNDGGGTVLPRPRGSLMLQPVSSGSVLTVLSVGAWPGQVCWSATCGTVRMR